MEPITDILLKGAPFYNIIRSLVEPVPNECTGHLFGYRENNTIVVCNAYPIQVAERRKWWVNTSQAAEQRLQQLESLLSNGQKATWVGGYHTHTQNKKRTMETDLSDEDFSFIRNSFKKGYNQENWLEVIATVERKTYTRDQETALLLREHKRKLEVVARDRPREGYRVLLGAFLVDRAGAKTELKIAGKPVLRA